MDNGEEMIRRIMIRQENRQSRKKMYLNTWHRRRDRVNTAFFPSIACLHAMIDRGASRKKQVGSIAIVVRRTRCKLLHRNGVEQEKKVVQVI